MSYNVPLDCVVSNYSSNRYLWKKKVYEQLLQIINNDQSNRFRCELIKISVKHDKLLLYFTIFTKSIYFQKAARRCKIIADGDQ